MTAPRFCVCGCWRVEVHAQSVWRPAVALPAVARTSNAVRVESLRIPYPPYPSSTSASADDAGAGARAPSGGPGASPAASPPSMGGLAAGTQGTGTSRPALAAIRVYAADASARSVAGTSQDRRASASAGEVTPASGTTDGSRSLDAHAAKQAPQGEALTPGVACSHALRLKAPRLFLSSRGTPVAGDGASSGRSRGSSDSQSGAAQLMSLPQSAASAALPGPWRCSCIRCREGRTAASLQHNRRGALPTTHRRHPGNVCKLGSSRRCGSLIPPADPALE